MNTDDSSRTNRRDALFFFFKCVFGKIDIPSESMSGGSLSEKLAELSSGKKVLEFGSGGSTLIFSQNSHMLISVESDFFYARKLRKVTRKFAHTTILWANIGPTGAFGNPIRKFEKFFGRLWPRYALRPWSEETRNLDLVFIDGRFRVCSAMQSFLNIESKFCLVFDDFFSRNEYHFVELFLGKSLERINDTAFFEVPELSERNELSQETLKEFDRYIYDFR